MKQIIQDKYEGKWEEGVILFTVRELTCKKRPLAHLVICHESHEEKGSFYIHLAET